MKKYIYILIVLLALPLSVMAQNEGDDAEKKEEKKKEKLERAAFGSSYIIDNPTDVVLKNNSLEVQFNHRFGLISDWNDFYGLWGDANIRLGAAYGVHERVTLGFGTSKHQRNQEFNAKVAILRQTRSDKMPVNLTFFGNFVYRAEKQTTTNSPPINYHQDRYSYFWQLILSRRFSSKFSMQFAPSVSHYNTVYDGMSNDQFAISIGGRYKISPQTSIMIDYSQPLNTYTIDTGVTSNDLKPGLSLGFEFGTSAHAFQVFATNYWGLTPQDNYMWNTNDFFSGDVLIGFTITRLYNF